MTADIRKFPSGASRDTETGKLDYDCLSPEVLRAFAIYMDFNRQMPDGSMRGADDWKKGIPLDVYMKSGTRHFMSAWLAHHGYQTDEGRLWALLGLLFNTMGYVHEFMKQHPSMLALSLSAALAQREKKQKQEEE